MTLKITKHIIRGDNYGKKRNTGVIKYIVIHYTSNDGDKAINNAKYFSSKHIGASANYFVDDEGAVMAVPDNYVAWHCGDKIYSNYKKTGGAKFYKKCTNTNSIGIELCDTNKDGKVHATDKTIANALELTKSLQKKYGIDNDHVIRHFDVSGKECPAYWCYSDAHDKAWKTEFHDKLGATKKVDTTPAKAPTKTPAVVSPKRDTTSYYTKTKAVGSLDSVLKAAGVPDKYRGNVKNRTPLAKKNGIDGYKGTAGQNIKLINLARAGKLIKL